MIEISKGIIVLDTGDIIHPSKSVERALDIIASQVLEIVTPADGDPLQLVANAVADSLGLARPVVEVAKGNVEVS